MREGQTMHHRVAQYWTECRDGGTRIFALSIGCERATVEYRFDRSAARFALHQLRGPRNAEPGGPMTAYARVLRTELNALERTPSRAELAVSLDARRAQRGPPARLTRRLDPQTERQLAAVLAHLRRVNADIARRLDAGEALSCRITRYDEQAETWERVELAIRQEPAQ